MSSGRALHRRPAVQSLLTAAPAVLVATVLAAVLAARIPGPSLLWDGQGYLGAARWIARDQWPNLGPLQFYHPAYGLLLAPAVWAGASPMGLFRWAQIVNVASVGVTAVTAGHLARSMLGLAGWRAMAATALAVASPGLLVQAGFEWPEAPFTALFTLAAALAWRGRVVPLAAVSVALYALHPRGLGIVAVTLVLAAVARSPAGIAVLAAGTAGVLALNLAARDALYHPGGGSATSSVFDKLLDGGEWPDVALRAAGHSWYVVVTTAGLTGVAVWALGATARGDRDPERRFALWLLGAVAALVLASALQLSGLARVDYLVYGRYVEPAVPVLLVIAAGVVLRRRHVVPLAAACAAAIVLAVITVAGNGTDRFDGNIAWINVAALHPLGGVEPALVTAIAVAGAVVLGAVARRAPAVVLALLAVAGMAGAVEVHAGALRSFAVTANRAYVMGDEVATFADRGRIAYDVRAYDLLAANRYQWQFPGLDLRFWRGGALPAGTVLTRKGSPPVEGARIVAAEPRRDLALWVRPGPRLDRLAERGWVVAVPGETVAPSFYEARIEPIGDRKVRITHDGGGAPWVPHTALDGDVGIVQVVVDGERIRLPRIVRPGESVLVTIPAGARRVELEHVWHRFFAAVEL